jgi:pyrroline-5-carboxylate reductase
MNPHTITFIGAGNMARSLIGGLLADGHDPARLLAADADAAARERLQRDFGITTHASNSDAARAADVIVLAVKPQSVAEVARGIAVDPGTDGRLVISIAAGIRLADLEGWLGTGTALVRAMPNTPALVQSGATALCANAHAGKDWREAAETILRAVGLTLWLDDEPQMDAVTALSGSGPAYFFLVMEALEAAGCRLGLPADTARVLTIQTAFGAAKMALESTDSNPAELRARVTSPGGTTERAIAVLQQGGIEALFERALAAGHARSIELSKYLGGMNE